MVTNNNENMKLEYNLKGKRGAIWVSLWDYYPDGIKITDLAEKVDMPQTTVSDQVSILRKAGFVITQKVATSTIVIPTVRPVYESIAKKRRVRLSKEDYVKIDKFYFNKKYTKKFMDLAMPHIDLDPVIMRSLMISSILNESTKLIKGDIELEKLWEPVKRIRKRLGLS